MHIITEFGAILDGAFWSTEHSHICALGNDQPSPLASAVLRFDGGLDYDIIPSTFPHFVVGSKRRSKNDISV